MPKREKTEEHLKETTIDIKNKEQISIVYEIKKKYVFVTAVKEFYENKFQIILGPMVTLIGIILKQYTNLNFICNILIAAGLFYIIFPYIMLIGNLTNVRAQKVNMEICEDGLHISDMLTKNNSLSVLGYKNIYDIEQDKYYVRIIPKDNKGKTLGAISIPSNHLLKGDIDAFTSALNSIVSKNGGGKEKEEESFTKGKIILSYTLSKNQYRDIYIKEYYKKKLHIFYIVAFAIISFISIFYNTATAIMCAIFCIFYSMYPVIMYRINLKDNIGEVIIRDCGDGYLSVIGEHVKVKVKRNKLQIVYNDEYIKYYIPIKKKYFKYIHKKDCDEMQLKKFIKIIEK